MPEPNGVRRVLFLIIGTLISLVAVLGGIVFSFDRNRLGIMETKVYTLEQDSAVTTERVKTIQHQLTRIEAKLDKLAEDKD